MTRHHVMLTMTFILFSGSLRAQVPTGTPPMSSLGGGPDIIDLANLNSHLDIPVLNKPGRSAMNFTYDLTYDSSVWYPVGSSGSQVWTPVNNWGWRGITEVATGYVSYSSVTVPWCLHGGQYYGQQTTNSNWVYHDQFGISHPFIGQVIITQGAPAYCNGSTTNLNATSGDGSGAVLTTNGGSGVITYTNGQVVTAPINAAAGAASMTDRNGNQITVNSSGQFFDTLSSSAAVLTVTGAGTVTSPINFKYTPPSNTPVSYVMNYTNYTVATNFAVSGIAEYKSSAAVPLVSSIVLPDGSQYTFTYEPTPTTPSTGACTPYAGTSCVTARVTNITLPTGGQIKYTYSGGAGTNGSGIFSDGSAATLTRTITPGGIWMYAQVKNSGAASTTTVTDPQNDITTINFQGIYETQRQVNQGSNTLLLTTNTCYNGASSPCNGTTVILPITQRSIISTLPPSNQVSKHVDVYSTYGMPTESDDYDYGAPGAIIKRVLITYASLGNINAFPRQVIVCNGIGSTSACNETGTLVSQTTYTYDGASLGTNVGTTPQHVAVSGPRGNLTNVIYPVGTSSPTNYTYFDSGMLNTSTDSNGAVTTYTFPDNSSTCGNAFPTKVNEPLSMSRSFVWNCTGGVMTQLTDENNQSTSTTYSDQFFWRPAQQTYPDGGQTTWAYTSSSTTTTLKMNSSQNKVGTVLLDGLGRTKQQQMSDPNAGTVYEDTGYDSLGRVASASNPYRSTSDTTYGVTTEQYDALSRPTLIIPPDGKSQSDSVSISYTNNCGTTVDQAGKSTKSCLDALGRTTQVFEDPSSLNLETDYTYDPLGDLLTVNQKGGSTNSANWRPRSYSYDGLARLTSETNPESGAVSYTYNSNGDLATKIVPAPNQTGTATETTTYTWDLLHRLMKKSYSDSTPTATYIFDHTTAPGFGANGIGRLVEATTNDGLTRTVFGYDNVGRVAIKGQCIPENCSTGWLAGLSSTYDLMGNRITYNNGWGYTFTQQFDATGRFYELTTNWTDATHPGALAYADWRVTTPYYPDGTLRALLLWNNLEETKVLNNRLQPCRMNVNSTNTILAACADAVPSGNVLDLNQGFNLGASDNGNVISWSAIGDQTFTRAYLYDSVNRVNSMTDSATAQSCKGLSWTYDAWGNRTDQTVTSGTCGTFHNAVDTNNRFVGAPYSYDAAGNMIHDASHSYTYDAEYRVTAVDGGATANYIYDAFGQRTKKATPGYTAEYIYNQDGQIDSIVENTHFTRGYIYLNGGPLVEYANNTTYFIHQDHLGSTRLVTAYPTPTIVECDDYYPFGEANACGANTTTTLKFTGDERDSETNLDHTQFRQNSSTLGRWMSPDPAGLAAVDLTSPQSWNRYAYVLNNPTNLIDPLGLWIGVPPGCTVSYPVGGGAGSIDCLSQPWLLWQGTNWMCSWFGMNCPTVSSSGGGGGSTSANTSGPANNKPASCQGVTPAQFDYTTPQIYMGPNGKPVIQSAQQHITQGHIFPGEAGNTMYGIFPWPGTNAAFQQVQVYNATTFTFGQPSQASPNSNITFTLTFPVTINPYNNLPAVIGYDLYSGPGVTPLNTNKLVLAGNCKLVRTSFATHP